MKATTTFTLSLCLVVLVHGASAHAQEHDPSAPTLPPGMAEVIGTYLEVTDSDYRNVALQSSALVDVALRSIPSSIEIHVAAADGAAWTLLTLQGLAPSTTYYRYEDTLDVGESFMTDEVGSATFPLDLFEPRVVFIHETHSTYFLAPSQGQIPVEIGSWNSNARVFTLTTDVHEAIQIGDSNLTLDGAGFRVIGTGTGSGIYVPYRNRVTVRNTHVEGFTYGIHYRRSSYATVVDNTVVNTGSGIYIDDVSYNATVTDNTVDDSSQGIFVAGNSHYPLVARNRVSNITGSCVTTMYSALAFIEDNVVSGCGYAGIANWLASGAKITGNTSSGGMMGLLLGWASNTTLRNNASLDNAVNFKVWGSSSYHWSHDIDASNLLDGKPLYYLVGVQDAVFDNLGEVASFWAINCQRITVNDLSVSGNSAGVYFLNTHDSRIENVAASGNQEYGIAVLSSHRNSVIGNHISNNALHGLVVLGDDNVVSGNVSTNNASWQRPGIWVSGARNAVTSNSAIGNVGEGFWLTGGELLVTDNYAEANDGGFEIKGCASCTIANNAAVGPGGFGFWLSTPWGGDVVDTEFVGNSAIGTEEGISVWSTVGLMLRDNVVQASSRYGIQLLRSTGVTMLNNSIQSDYPAVGLRVSESPSSTLSGNSVTGTGRIFSLEGRTLDDYVQVIDETNMLNGRPVVYVNGETGRTIDAASGAGAVIAVNSDGLVVRDLELHQVALFQTHNSLLENITIDNGGAACASYQQSAAGMSLRFSDDNVIVGNTFRCNHEGLSLEDSSGNHVYHNNFLENLRHAIVAGGIDNTFNAARPDGGNYWDDGGHTDADADGFVDHPYRVYGTSTAYDYLPWTVASGWATPEILIGLLVASVEEINLAAGIEGSFDAKLGAAEQALTDVNESNDSAAVNSLEAFINAVEAQRGHKLVDEQADMLVAAARAIISKVTGG